MLEMGFSRVRKFGVKKIAAALMTLCLLSAMVHGQESSERQLPQTQEQIQLSFAPLVKKSAPAVVNIYATRRMRMRSPFEGDPFFDQFFGRRRSMPPDRLQSSLGSGVIVEAQGLIVTNYHVIRDAEAIKVALADGREFTSHLIMEDEASDIAILQIEGGTQDFPTLSLGDSDKVEVGDLVLAIGNPFGVGQTVTSGIVSAQARSRVGLSDNDYFIQTDAAINPGNSGGALVNMAGELIGINTAIYSRSGGSIGIGFAIPSNLVRAFIINTKQGETHFEQPYFGADLQYVTLDIAKSLGLEVPYGALVADVDETSPAAKAGIEVGDVIVTAQGVRVDNPDMFGYRLLTTGANEALKLEVLRAGEIVPLEAVLLGREEASKMAIEVIEGSSPLAGAQVANVNGDMRHRFRLRSDVRGVIIVGFERGAVAANIFQAGDVLHNVNGEIVRSVADLQQILAQRRGRGWQFEYERAGVVIRQFFR